MASHYKGLAREALKQRNSRKRGNKIKNDSTNLKPLNKLELSLTQEMAALKAQVLTNTVDLSSTNEIVIVSGLPRSGTSMMMQILTAGGVSVWTDNIRKANEFNQHGYYELENVKSLATDSTWVPKARGKAIKVIAPLLEYLPSGENYKIILMCRNLEDVLHSQANMLNQDNSVAIPDLADEYRRQLLRAISVMKKLPNTVVQIINYEDVINDPVSASNSVAEFLVNHVLEIDAMPAAVLSE